ncbi:MAG: hypothetical protein H6705_18580 [Myxococcales bacterium]|nr:hypothetical protein [Myxococcales bacterium]
MQAGVADVAGLAGRAGDLVEQHGGEAAVAGPLGLGHVHVVEAQAADLGVVVGGEGALGVEAEELRDALGVDGEDLGGAHPAGGALDLDVEQDEEAAEAAERVGGERVVEERGRGVEAEGELAAAAAFDAVDGADDRVAFADVVAGVVVALEEAGAGPEAEWAFGVLRVDDEGLDDEVDLGVGDGEDRGEVFEADGLEVDVGVEQQDAADLLFGAVERADGEHPQVLHDVALVEVGAAGGEGGAERGEAEHRAGERGPLRGREGEVSHQKLPRTPRVGRMVRPGSGADSW